MIYPSSHYDDADPPRWSKKAGTKHAFYLAAYHMKKSTAKEPNRKIPKDIIPPQAAMKITTMIKKRMCFHSITFPLISSAFPHANARNTKRARHKTPVTRSNARPYDAPIVSELAVFGSILMLRRASNGQKPPAESTARMKNPTESTYDRIAELYKKLSLAFASMAAAVGLGTAGLLGACDRSCCFTTLFRNFDMTIRAS